MQLATFDDLLSAARSQAQPQRLLFVFARAELPRDATEEERLLFEQGLGGALEPAVCVDRSPDEVAGFDQLLAESRQALEHWDILFVAAMEGRAGVAPNPDEAEQPLRMMVEQIRAGRIGRFLAVDRSGRIVELDAH